MIRASTSRMRKLAAMAALLIMAGCAHQRGQVPISAQDAQDARLMAATITTFLTQRFPPAATTLSLQQTQREKRAIPVENELLDALRAAGFAIAQPGAEHAVSVNYGVRALNGGVVVIIRTPGQEAAQWFGRTSQGLEPGSFLSIRDVTQ